MAHSLGFGIVLRGIKFYYASYLPEAYRYIQEARIPIISAHDLFSPTYPNEIKEWKERTFQQLPATLNMNKSIPTNLICIGDFPLEIDAAHSLGQQFTEIAVKTLKGH